jgi:hypothetical protein
VVEVINVDCEDLLAEVIQMFFVKPALIGPSQAWWRSSMWIVRNFWQR